MAEVVYYVAASVDGYIATPDGAVDWLAPFHTDGEDHGYNAFLATLGGIVMGRRTYDQVRGFGPWPYTGLDCRVVTSRPVSSSSGTGSQTPNQPMQSTRGHRRRW